MPIRITIAADGRFWERCNRARHRTREGLGRRFGPLFWRIAGEVLFVGMTLALIGVFVVGFVARALPVRFRPARNLEQPGQSVLEADTRDGPGHAAAQLPAWHANAADRGQSAAQPGPNGMTLRPDRPAASER